ncbi:MAG: cation:proton antiporter [Clostridiaceae bacterium]
MLEIHFLVDLAFILLSTKFLGLLTKKIRMPQVVGALIAGLILGPSLLNIVHETDFIIKMSELGVIVLMFGAGLETDVKELKKAGKASFVIAVIGVLIPLLGGFLVAIFFNNDGSAFNLSNQKLLENIFMGIILTATSVSITVETLQELGKLNTKSGTAILGAAVIDDILGIILLTVITSLTDPKVNIYFVLFKIVAFFALAVLIGILFYKLFNRLSKKHGKKRRLPIVAFSFCLIMAFVAEKYFGVADITGAYLAGIIISNTTQARYIKRRVEIMSYMLLSPIFFASVGLKATFSGMNLNLLIFTVLLLVIAILTKVIGCGLGAKVCGYTKDESLRIGVGMISRGEVALIVANLGAQYGLMNPIYFAPIIIVVIITTIITPILLKVVYSKTSPADKGLSIS